MQRHVLVVDDSPAMRTLVCATLQELGFRTSEATNGREALDRLGTMKSVDVIVTDLNMPVMDGLVLVEEIRKLEAFRDVPVLMLTSETRTVPRGKAKAAGATHWLTKPFDREQLIAVIKRMSPT